jgi:patatin-related protein
MNRLQVEPIQEFRFAVVMYGGVSLAIYINGITQELLELVKATAPAPNPDKEKGDFAYISTENLSASGKVYRKIGQLLGNKSLQEKENLQVSDITPDLPIYSRFVIDILSGTSAGGINAVFLAKALANDQQIDQLKNLWIKEGDISKLINDSNSVDDQEMRRMGLKTKPNSLLNSQRMYLKLLEAFEGMDKKTSSSPSPYVNELDLFVTTTNLHGQVIPIQLKDKIVTEKNYRHVFHFIFNQDDNNYKPRNDFSARFSPFLAFVARCTSSFPLAFEPMTLQDALDILKFRPSYKKEDLVEWKKLFFATDTNQSICGEEDKPLDLAIEQRAFGDGGYLDNKPFTYATEALLRRRSDLPIKRHLIYIEPSPEHPENDSQSDTKPNAIENGIAALITIPRNETIRQDIQQIINRNKIIRRIDRITDDNKIAQDIKDFNNSNPQATVESFTSKTGEDWKEKNLKDLIIERGISYGNYHRLKIATVTDELARLITRVSGFNYDDESAEFIALRLFLREWRIDQYHESPTEEEKAQGKKTETEFLLNFDFDYRLRRLYFVRRKINNLFLKKENEEIRNEFKEIKKKLSQTINNLLLVRRALEKSSRSETIDTELQETNSLDFNKVQEFSGLINSIGIQRDFLTKILAGHTEELRTNKVKEVLSDYQDKLQEIAKVLAEIFRTCFEQAAHDCKTMMDVNTAEKASWQEARRNVKFFYDYYENYDMGIFPITYGTEVGEADEVEIIRISPEDADSLDKKNKLAGTSFFAFGGFFDKDWRKNDIRWGRLDGSERLITTLLPGDDYKDIRTALIKEAHQGILAEAIEASDRKNLLENLLQDVQFSNEDSKENAKNSLATLQNLFNSEVIYKLFKDKYQVKRNLPPEILLSYLSRSTQVFGDVLDNISKQKKNIPPAIPLWLNRFGRILWAFLEISSSNPSILIRLFRRYSLPLIYFTEIFIIVFGFILNQKAALNLGLLTFSITLIITLSVLWGEDLMQKQTKITKRLAIAFFFFTTTLILIGILYLSKYGFSNLLNDFKDLLNI